MEILRGPTVDLNPTPSPEKTDWSRASSGYLSICSKSSPEWSSSEQVHDNPPSSTSPSELTGRVGVSFPVRDEELPATEKTDGSQFVHTLLFPPDGGPWGWLVCCSCALVTFVVVGTTSVHGLLLTSLPKDSPLQTDNLPLVWVLGARNAVILASVPIGRLVSRHFGCRVSCFLGTSLCLFGYLLALSATSVRYLILSSGITIGVGSSTCLQVSLMMVSEYFQYHWNRAQAIVLSGAGLGLLAFPLLVDILLRRFDLLTTVLIMCGVSLAPYAVLPALGPACKHYAVRHFLSPHSTMRDSGNDVALPLVVPIREKSWPRRQQTNSIPSGGSVLSAVKLLPHNLSFALLLFSAVLVGGVAHPQTLTMLPFHSDTLCTGKELWIAGVTFILGFLGPFYSLTRWAPKLQPLHLHTLSALILSCATLSLLPCPCNLIQVLSCTALMGLGLCVWGCTLPMVITSIVGEEQSVGAMDLTLIIQGLSGLSTTFIEGETMKGNVGQEIVFYFSGCSTLAGFIFLIILMVKEH